MNLYLFSFVAVFYSLLSLNSTRQSQLKQYLPRSSIIETRANEQRVGKPIGNLTTDPQQWLDATNKARAKFFSRPVKWNESLAEVALKVSRTCKMGHSAGKFGPMGENLGMGDPTIESVVINGWAHEAVEYDHQKPEYNHFTQLVWDNTHFMGCANVLCDNIVGVPWWPTGKNYYFVCEYWGPNDDGKGFAGNIRACKGGKPLPPGEKC